jgi:ABC-type transport system involved in cytochrome bd biosynthesis fused ATPase/permease subunit
MRVSKQEMMKREEEKRIQELQQYLIRVQQIRLFIEKMAIPVLLLIVNTVLLIITVINISWQRIIVMSIFAVFSLIFYILTIYLGGFKDGRSRDSQ